MDMSQNFYPILVSHKSKIPSKSHNKVFDILHNLILHNSLIQILNIPCTQFLHIDKIKDLLILK